MLLTAIIHAQFDFDFASEIRLHIQSQIAYTIPDIFFCVPLLVIHKDGLETGLLLSVAKEMVLKSCLQLVPHV